MPLEELKDLLEGLGNKVAEDQAELGRLHTRVAVRPLSELSCGTCAPGRDR